YALGCSLFHMCSGHPPFRKGGQDDHYTAVVRRHLRSERPELKYEIKGFDEPLSDLCRRMMSRRPDVRPSFDELKANLTEISKRLGGQVPPRHIEVELRSPEELTERLRQEQKKGSGNPQAGVAHGAGNRTTMIAIAAGVGIAIGIAVGIAVVVI